MSDILSLIFSGMKSLNAIAARAFRPVLIVLLGIGGVKSKKGLDLDLEVGKANLKVRKANLEVRKSNLSDPENTPAMKSPGRPGMSPAT